MPERAKWCQSTPSPSLLGRASLRAALTGVSLVLTGPAAQAINFDTGSEDLKLRWDNTFKYSAAARLQSPSTVLTSPAANANNANLDDGDRNFGKGLISNRLDLLSEFDATYKDVGLRITGAAWYDRVYNRPNDNPGFAGGAFPNQVSVPENQFTAVTRKTHGRDAEILDAFVFGSVDLGGASRASLRVGRHGMIWGDTLFFGANGIAGGMVPIDVVKAVSVPNTQFKETIRPVPMVSGQWQINADVGLSAYVQTRWEASRLPTVGSYFSVADTQPDGAERALAGPGSFPRGDDLRPKDSGQGGLQLRARFDETDVGVYLIRFHVKAPNAQVVRLGPTGPQSYRLVYAEGITALGFGGNRNFGALNLAAEASVRDKQPFNTPRARDTSLVTGGLPTDNTDNPGYPVGRSAHINIAALWSIERNPLFNEGSLAAELAWNRVLSVSKNAALMDPATTRDAVALRGVLQATYRQVVPGLDLMPLIGLGWAPKGSRSAITTANLPQNGNGDLTLGLEGAFRDEWRGSLSFTHYFGGSGSFLTPVGPGLNSYNFRQYYGDRDFVSLSIRRTF